MLMFNLVIFCLLMSNLSWFMDLTFWFPMQYCSLQHQTFLPPLDTSTAENLSCFGLAASLFLELLIIALFTSPVAYWWSLLIWGAHLLVLYLFAFSYCPEVLQARILEWIAIFLSRGPCFFRTLHYDPSVLGSLAWHVSLLHWVSPFATTRLCSIKGS